VVHAAEEYFLAFYSVDPTIHLLAVTLGVQPLSAWILVEVLVFILVALVYRFQSLKVLWALLLLFIFAQLYHFYLAIFQHEYGGLITAFLFVPLLWLVYKASPLQSVPAKV
jgi:hypothetical protein